MNGTATLIPNLSDLTDDGDEIDLPDGRSLRLRIEPDQDASVNDSDCYGRIEWSHVGPHNYTGRANRPDDFTGAAHILDRDHGSVLWWQPWEGATEEQARDFLPTLRELVEYGFKLVGLELRETVTDSLGSEHTVVLDTAWLGGVDDTGSDYLQEIIGEMLHELPGDLLVAA